VINIGRYQWPSDLRRRSSAERLTITGGNVISPTHRSPLPQGDTPCAQFYDRLIRGQVRGAVRRNNQLKIPMTPIGNRTRDLQICGSGSQEITILK